jgi:type VI secretion system protein ImpJ
MWKNRVLWSEGQFLRPQHFQQQDRAIGHELDLRVRSLQPFGWGFTTLELDVGALARGIVQINSASGVLPDGTPFSIPDVDPAPAPLEIGPALKDTRILLAVPLLRPGVPASVFPPGAPGSLARYEAADYDATDSNEGFVESAPVQVARLRPRLMTAGAQDGAFAAVAVCRVLERKPDGRVELDPGFVPPVLHVGAAAPLRSWLAELRGLLAQRTEAMAQRLAGPGRGGVAEIAEFLLLMATNRSKPVLDHLANLPVLHPERLYAQSVELLGELSTFDGERRLATVLPAYDHNDLEASFRPVIVQLRLALSRIVDPTAMAIELIDRGYGVRVAIVNDKTLFASASFVLAVNAQMAPDAIRSRFPVQAKIGPSEKIKDLVNLQLPGIGLRPLPVAPRQIPYHAGFNYFELDNRGELWRALERSAAMALHTGGEFPGLELELWAIRR